MEARDQKKTADETAHITNLLPNIQEDELLRAATWLVGDYVESIFWKMWPQIERQCENGLKKLDD